jgi:methylmalonyl-CoA/ethylmalonyl-CoA epimerase
MPNRPVPHRGLDHIAIAVADTEEALTVWRDKFGLPVVLQEKVNNDTVLLTHLDLGNVHLQLVQPLVRPHPIWDWLAKNGGPGLHHFCLKVDDVSRSMEQFAAAGIATAAKMHQGTSGKRALFIDKSATQGVQAEITGG